MKVNSSTSPRANRAENEEMQFIFLSSRDCFRSQHGAQGDLPGLCLPPGIKNSAQPPLSAKPRLGVQQTRVGFLMGGKTWPGFHSL